MSYQPAALGFNPLAYEGVEAVNPANVIYATRAPTVNDLNFNNGSIWIDQTALTAWIKGISSANQAQWIAIGTGSAGGISTVTGDSGGAVSPLAGNLTLVGDSVDGVSVAGTPNTETINIAQATTVQRGTLETSTDAESITGTSILVSVTPASLTARLAEPGPIGGTIPDTGDFTTLTATGDITSTGGNLVLSGAASQVQVEGGAVTDFIGTATLALGTATVLNTNIAATDRIIAFHIDPGLSTAIGTLTYTIIAATSFAITSLNATAATEAGDLSTVGYFIVRQL